MKKVAFYIIALMLIITGILYAKPLLFLPPQNINRTNQEITVSQIVYFPSKGKKESLNMKMASKKTALNLLQLTNTVQTTGEKENVFITAIGGVAADPNKREYWSLHINGKPSGVGAGTYILRNGDKIEWKLETY